MRSSVSSLPSNSERFQFRLAGGACRHLPATESGAPQHGRNRRDSLARGLSATELWPADLTEEFGSQSNNADITAALGSYMQDCERSFIEAQLLAHDWNCSRTAISLGISRKKL